MFLRAKVRKKDGKQHRYFSVVENRRVGQNPKRMAQRTVLYLGQINDGQEAAWRKSLEVFDESCHRYSTLSLFPEDREIPAEASPSVQVKLSEMELRRPRMFGNCWLGCELRQRWQDLFAAQFDVLLYDLTSTYIEGEGEQIPKAKYGYSRDQRFDCKQVVIALVITPEGFPLAYEVMEGNTSDKTTLRAFLDKIEAAYGRARRVWLMDRGIATEAVLAELRASPREVFYLVGTRRSKIRQYERKWLDLPWQKVREAVEVKLFAEEGELYVLAKSEGRRVKERAMRRKKVARLLWKLRAMRRSCPRRDPLLLRLGAAKKEAGGAARFVAIQVPPEGQPVTRQSFHFRVDKPKLQKAEAQDSHYLLRSNLVGGNPAVLWERYVQLTHIEAAFKTLKSELGIRPLYHQLGSRVEGHILIAFLAYCLWVTLKKRLQALAPGLTPQAVLEKLATLQMLGRLAADH